MSQVKRVYSFGNGKAEGRADMRNLLGGKGANLAEMNLIGVPVPPGFTITTEVCSEYNKMGKDKVVELLKPEVEKAMANIEKLMGAKFGDRENPCLVSVRSGARVSMPGMMDTVLNLGRMTMPLLESRKNRATSVSPGTLPSFRTDVWRCCSRNETRKQRRYRPV